MYNEPQISCQGEWGDASFVEDNKGRLNYYCKYCGYKCRAKETIILHLYKCIENNKLLKENKDFVICKICNFHAQNLSIHLKKIHNINSEEYMKLYSSNVISSISHKKYSENHFSYLTYAKENNINLSDYSSKMSDSVSKSILSNSEERKRRSELMSEINKTDHMRSIASITAIKTSSRPEIQAQRSQNLKKWRDENYEDFFNKCIKKMIGSFQSKPEKQLFNFVKLLQGFSFKRNQFVHSKLISNKSNKKQIDMADKCNRIYIEYDGVLHFKPIFGDEKLKEIQLKDNEIENHLSNHNWTLIRICYDQFIYSTKQINKTKYDNSYFKKECLDKIIEILNNKIPGIYKIGEAYV